jgi:hypothetical protein
VSAAVTPLPVKSREERFAEADAMAERILDDLEIYGELVRDIIAEHAPSRRRTSLLADAAHRDRGARSYVQLLRVVAARAKGLGYGIFERQAV